MLVELVGGKQTVISYWSFKLVTGWVFSCNRISISEEITTTHIHSEIYQVYSCHLIFSSAMSHLSLMKY